jgi:branched-chain amino acid transport system permease protein
VIGPVELGNSLIAGLLFGGILALTALGLSLVLGVMQVVNLAHGELLVGGAFLASALFAKFHLDPLLALPLTALAVALLTYPVQRVLIEPIAGKGPEITMMTTFGLSIILQNVYLAAFAADSRSIDVSYAASPLRLGPFTTPTIYAIGFAVSVLIIGLVHFVVTRTAFGRDLRACAEDPNAAAVLGVNVVRIRALTFALGAACAAVGGVLIGVGLTFSPTSGATYLFNNFAVLVLGGVGNILGTLVGGLFLGLAESIGGVTLGDGWRDFVGIVIFLGVLALRPEGLLRSARASL